MRGYLLRIGMIVCIVNICSIAFAQATVDTATTIPTIAPTTAVVAKSPLPDVVYNAEVLQKPYDTSLYRLSKDFPTAFNVPNAIAPQVMQKAQAIIANWPHSNMNPRQIRIILPDMVQTEDPKQGGQLAFTITCSPNGQTTEVSVREKVFTGTGSLFTAHGDKKDAHQRACHLAYVLCAYARTLEVTPSVPQVPVVNAGSATTSSKLRPEIEALLTSIRALLEAGENEAAIAQMEVLKSLVSKQLAQPAVPAPTSPPR